MTPSPHPSAARVVSPPTTGGSNSIHVNNMPHNEVTTRGNALSSTSSSLPLHSNEDLMIQLQRLQFVQDYLLSHREQECGMLRDQLEAARLQIQQLKVENAVLQEKLQHQQGQIQQDLKYLQFVLRQQTQNLVGHQQQYQHQHQQLDQQESQQGKQETVVMAPGTLDGVPQEMETMVQTIATATETTTVTSTTQDNNNNINNNDPSTMATASATTTISTLLRTPTEEAEVGVNDHVVANSSIVSPSCEKSSSLQRDERVVHHPSTKMPWSMESMNLMESQMSCGSIYTSTSNSIMQPPPSQSISTRGDRGENDPSLGCEQLPGPPTNNKQPQQQQIAAIMTESGVVLEEKESSRVDEIQRDLNGDVGGGDATATANDDDKQGIEPNSPTSVWNGLSSTETEPVPVGPPKLRLAPTTDESIKTSRNTTVSQTTARDDKPVKVKVVDHPRSIGKSEDYGTSTWDNDDELQSERLDFHGQADEESEHDAKRILGNSLNGYNHHPWKASPIDYRRKPTKRQLHIVLKPPPASTTHEGVAVAAAAVVGGAGSTIEKKGDSIPSPTPNREVTVVREITTGLTANSLPVHITEYPLLAVQEKKAITPHEAHRLCNDGYLVSHNTASAKESKNASKKDDKQHPTERNTTVSESKQMTGMKKSVTSMSTSLCIDRVANPSTGQNAKADIDRNPNQLPPKGVTYRGLPSIVEGSKDVDEETIASTTYGEELETVFNRSINDPYGDAGVYTGVILRSTAMPHGKGKMVYNEDGRIYDGEWRHGRWHGFGRATFANGDHFSGQYCFDQRHGKGRYEWADGRVYDGMFCDDRRHGFGRFIWPDGAVYEGDFKNGQRDGQGIYTFSTGARYEGGWKDGRYSGFGISRWEDGRCYEGEWLEGMAHGNGKETRADGTIRHDGLWIEDEPVVE